MKQPSFNRLIQLAIYYLNQAVNYERGTNRVFNVKNTVSNAMREREKKMVFKALKKAKEWIDECVDQYPKSDKEDEGNSW